MKEPRILRPDLLRRVPTHFSWVDHRLVRDKHMQRCDANAWALYLFLVTVGNAQGVSWYADPTLARLLNISENLIAEARRQLVKHGLIAFDQPLYQVLDLRNWQPPLPVLPRTSPPGSESLGDILRRLGGSA
ncbi:MAG: hypothetical protein G8345_13960 [Magnetococcales bacterium]|nr:hypothetical protein [Magnetococcales bacterium]